MKLTSALDIIDYCHKSSVSLDALALAYETKKTEKTPEYIESYLKSVLKVMENAVASGINDVDNHIHGKIIGNDSIQLKKRYESQKTVCGETIAKAAAYALGTMEVNASMGKVVASPTAGSCGVLPAVLVTAKERFDLTEAQLIKGLLAANMVGSIVARNATISGAEGGCQAEVGTASAMASAAVVHMMGGSVEQVFNASAMCFKNLLGLVCDPIAGLVESPCAKRNAIGAANALLCAEMSLAEIKSIIPFDEVVDAMYRVGKSMPSSLRETALGGLATTKTGIQIATDLFSK
ncbi:L-serine ammonia-lyase, iron-sulfur-dependent, subunit alpha [Fusibacter ferrireducens]|uniref:L-serine dehydratase n=1 Tax=Fusibacter ferrireducens TaxID=2785058 RepID=A0ABR9ZR83_9FIRM|nr:L-serine ammonia-lyase, iron-sulfur-dependent, subunit alpha [Fusibacter ferrireducens]MBF4692963.1 L-serine ammonia-lyase, iron-sulfur-dependent, subunit alpha [Fusibacter ferrireducens]